jgi:hypothetical protein
VVGKVAKIEMAFFIAMEYGSWEVWGGWPA